MKKTKESWRFLETRGHDDLVALAFFVAAGAAGYLVTYCLNLLRL